MLPFRYLFEVVDGDIVLPPDPFLNGWIVKVFKPAVRIRNRHAVIGVDRVDGLRLRIVNRLCGGDERPPKSENKDEDTNEKCAFGRGAPKRRRCDWSEIRDTNSAPPIYSLRRP